MGYNLPQGCTTEDIDKAFGQEPKTCVECMYFIESDDYGVCRRELEDALLDQLFAGMDVFSAAQLSCRWTLAHLKDADEDACERFEG